MSATSAVSSAPTFNSGHVPGNKGIWVGIFCVLLVIFSHGWDDVIKRWTTLN